MYFFKETCLVSPLVGIKDFLYSTRYTEIRDMGDGMKNVLIVKKTKVYDAYRFLWYFVSP